MQNARLSLANDKYTKESGGSAYVCIFMCECACEDCEDAMQTGLRREQLRGEGRADRIQSERVKG